MEASGAYQGCRRFGFRQAAMAELTVITESLAAGSISIVDLDGRFFPCDGIAHRKSPVLSGSTNRHSQKAEGIS